MSETVARKSTPPDYIARMLAHLEDQGQQPLTVMGETPGRLRVAVTGLGEEELARAEGPGKWSIAQVVQHLADCEWVLGFRFRKVAAENDVILPFFNQDAWAQELNFGPQDTGQALADFEALRGINLRFLRGLPADRLARAGHHPERGDESIEYMIRLYAGHDLAHLRQIERIKQATAR